MSTACVWLGVVDAQGVVAAWSFKSDSLGMPSSAEIERQVTHRLLQSSNRAVHILPHHEYVLVSRGASSCGGGLVFAIIGQTSHVLDLDDFLRLCFIPAAWQVMNLASSVAVADRDVIRGNLARLSVLVHEVILQGRIQRCTLDAALRQYKLAAAQDSA